MSRRKSGASWVEATRKKAARPRPAPAVPLTDAEREEKFADAMRKAAIHLAEAEAMGPWGGAPNACVHAAYYAMYFVAVAALYRAGGVGKRKDVPESHEHVLQHYIALAEKQGGALGESGRILNRARDARVQCDYFQGLDGTAADGPYGMTGGEAAELAAAARAFLDLWRRRWET